jgi:hypothetical protein
MCNIPEVDESAPVVVQRVYRGAFSSVEADEALVAMMDTGGAHVNNFSATALLRRSGNAWKRIALTLGELVGKDCVMLAGAPPRRAFLACPGEYGMQGSVSWSLSLVHVAGNAIDSKRLFCVYDNSRSPTAPGAAALVLFTPEHPSLEMRDVDGDGLTDLRVRLTVGRLRLEEGEYRDYKGEPLPEVADVLAGRRGERAAVTLVFRNTGSDLEPDPDALTRIRALNSCERP